MTEVNPIASMSTPPLKVANTNKRGFAADISAIVTGGEPASVRGRNNSRKELVRHADDEN